MFSISLVTVIGSGTDMAPGRLIIGTLGEGTSLLELSWEERGKEPRGHGEGT